MANLSFKKVNFKDALIDEIRQFFPDFITMEASYHNVSVEQLFDKKPGFMRQFMQNFGTELRRSENPHYWINKWTRKIEAHALLSSKYEPNFVVDDVRFLNEAKAVRKLGGKIVRIIKIGQESADGHQSETEMSNIVPDFTIEVYPGSPELIEQAIENYVRVTLSVRI